MSDNPYESPRVECENPSTFVESPDQVLTAAFEANEKEVFFTLLSWIEEKSRLHYLLAGFLVTSFLLGLLGFTTEARFWSILLMVISLLGTLGTTICFVIPWYLTRTFLLVQRLRQSAIPGGPTRYQITLKPTEIVVSTPAQEVVWSLGKLSVTRTSTLCVIKHAADSSYPVPIPRSSFMSDESYMTFCATLESKDLRVKNSERRLLSFFRPAASP